MIQSPPRKRVRADEFGEQEKDATHGLQDSSSHRSDSQQAVPGGEVRMLLYVLTSHHEAESCGATHQQQGLKEPVQADLPLTGLEAERVSLSGEEQDPFSHTQAKLRRERNQDMFKGDISSKTQTVLLFWKEINTQYHSKVGFFKMFF